MVNRDDPYQDAQDLSAEGRTFRLLCGISALEAPLIGYLEALGLLWDQHADMVLLFDLPCGFALLHLPEMPQPEQVIVLTDDPCAEYCEDLWAERPAGLLTGLGLDRRLVEAMALVARGCRYRYPPSSASALTPTERVLLRTVACGWDNRRIARQLHLEEKTVRNVLTSVYHKLHVDNRVQAALYYWGRAALCR